MVSACVQGRADGLRPNRTGRAAAVALRHFHSHRRRAPVRDGSDCRRRYRVPVGAAAGRLSLARACARRAHGSLGLPSNRGRRHIVRTPAKPQEVGDAHDDRNAAAAGRRAARVLATGSSAQTDTAPAGVRVGDTVEVTFPAEITGALFKCTIAGSRDGFVRCEEEESRTSLRSGRVTWHNLRLAWQVRVLPRDEFAIR